MPGDLKALVIQPPSDGLDNDSAIDAVPNSKAPVLDNFLTHYVGKAVMRGPLTGTDLSLPNNTGLGIWTFGDGILMGHASTSGGGTREPWVAPYRKAAAATDLIGVQTHGTFIDVAAGTATDIDLHVVPAKRTRFPGPRFTRTATAAYGITLIGQLAPINELGGYQALTSLMRWGSGGTAAADTDMVQYLNAPYAAQDVKFHYQRLFMLGGTEPGVGSGIEPHALRYTDALDSLTDLPDTTAAWQDDISGLTNKLIVGNDDNTDFGVALARVGQNLAIFKRHSVYVLTGSTPANFAIKTFTEALGCIDARSIVEVEDGCYFMSDQGYMYFDGVQILPASNGVRSTLLPAALAACGDQGVDIGWIRGARLPNGYLALIIGIPGAVTWAGLLNISRGVWVNISSDSSQLAFMYTFGSTRNSTWLLSTTWFVRADYVTVPELAPENKRGFDRANSTSAPIPARWYSKMCNLATPTARSQLHRFLFDYNFDVDGAADDANNGWYVTLVHGDSTTLQSEYQVPAGGDPTVHTYRRRHVKDVYTEANDVQVRVLWKTTASALKRAEILPSTIEYQVTRARPRE